MSNVQPQFEQNSLMRWASPAWLLVPILLAGAWWRTRYLSEISYWFDESSSLRMVLTPSDPVSMMMMIPLCILCEFGILLCGRKSENKSPFEAAAA